MGRQYPHRHRARHVRALREEMGDARQRLRIEDRVDPEAVHHAASRCAPAMTSSAISSATAAGERPSRAARSSRWPTRGAICATRSSTSLSSSPKYSADTLMIRSEEHTSELQSLMRISYAVFCLQKKKTS